MQIFALGHNHDTASVEIRERFAFAPERIGDALTRVLGCSVVRESVIISTCNRNEIYSVVSDADRAARELGDFLHEYHDVEAGLAAPSLYTLVQETAVDHLFSVASGIDSMVVGETQVFAQLKEAFSAAREARTAGPILTRLFTSSFEASKKVRRRTRVSQGSISVSSCAVELANKIFTDFSGKTTLLIGAGENSEQTARILRDHGAERFIVANRTPERAAALAARLEGTSVPLDAVGDAMREADIVITSTSASETLVAEEDIRPIMRERQNRALFVIDLSVPRDVDQSVRRIHNVFVYDVDDLSAIAEENRAMRVDEVARAREIIQHEVATFMAWYRALEVTPTVVAMRRHFEEVRAAELKKLDGKVPPELRQRIDAVTRSITNKLLHAPTAEIKASADRDEIGRLTYAVRKLFRLEESIDDE